MSAAPVFLIAAILTENPHVVLEQRNQGRFGNVWAEMFRGRIKGSLIYNDTLTSQAYLEILRQEMEPFIDELPLVELDAVYFQHDGAPPLNSPTINNFLAANFGNNWIGIQGPNRWPASGFDTNGFFLWGRLKDLIFTSLTPLEIISADRSVQKGAVCIL